MNDINAPAPTEAAFAMQHYIRPVTVMPSHVNEQATSGGIEVSGSRVDRFCAPGNERSPMSSFR